MSKLPQGYGPTAKNLALVSDQVLAISLPCFKAEDWTSLAAVAGKNRYARPRIFPHPTIKIFKGRDPIVERIINNTLVPNKCEFTPNSLLMIILTGYNWGGKLVTPKMSGCIVLLAQMGSFVPAKRATVGFFDGCYTRMGMSEEQAQGQSVFMVKIINAAKILWMATLRPLVIIDELSYGSSTYDGVAIPNAVLDHLASICCFFSSLYHSLSISVPSSCFSGLLDCIHYPLSPMQ
ncbi:hypothetical protein PTTG_30053 [Puccinia triticina 1-1 BBBD Race 1]|uniref:MutS protein homolog 3 n=1 Tax=Puccinia triticina (isolate 1-1 / race 1 (BBBD)) TaxID=630390 RepID=A0A180G0D2_PUCT1|nr:hypothetical protein PTTG_30053 [Puccinia triticina 1-1 BBBD Race 1]